MICYKAISILCEQKAKKLKLCLLVWQVTPNEVQMGVTKVNVPPTALRLQGSDLDILNEN